MEKGAKIALIGGGLLLAAGIGVAIYAATRTKTTTIGTENVPPGEPPTGSGTGMINIGQVKDLAGNLIQATQEKFPLRIGMAGQKVKALQEALKTKFNKTSVATDGIFGVKTWAALKDLGYVTFVLNTLNEGDYNKVLAGTPKTQSADGASNSRLAGANLGSYIGLMS